jgi:DNA-binding HxlR family transcriptional regulator
MAKKLATHFNCPSEFALDVLGGKWKTVILCYLKYQSLRYAELRRLLPALSDKVLSERLRELGDKGLVTKRQADSGRGSAVYSLSERGRSLSALLEELYDWGARNAADFGVRVDEPLKRLGYRL